MVRVIFWSHFLVCLAAHLFTPFMIVYAVMLVTSWSLGIVGTAAMLGVILCASVWGVNHVTNPQGFCWLTTIEQQLRETYDLPPCNPAFLPRFYEKCRQIFKRGDFSSIPE